MKLTSLSLPLCLCLSFPHLCNGMVTLSRKWAYRRHVGSQPTQNIPWRHTNPVLRQCLSARTPSNPWGPHIPSLSRQNEQPSQRLTAKARTSLRAMAPAGSALRGWDQEHPQGGRGLGSHPGESPAPFGGPLLPLPCLTHRPVPGALEEEPPVPSPATPSFWESSTSTVPPPVRCLPRLASAPTTSSTTW